MQDWYRDKNKIFNIAGIALLLIMCLLFFFAESRVQTQAAIKDLSQIQQTFESAIKNGQNTIVFETYPDYTIEEIQTQISEAAYKQQYLYTRQYSYQKVTNGTYVRYTFQLTKDSLLKVRILKSRTGACKAALEALQNSNYATRFYSKTSYYPEFRLMMLQHPEYNYNTQIWRSTNGTYGYYRSDELTASEQNAMVQAADKKAAAIVRQYISSDMTTLEKIRKLHNYLVANCSYDYSLSGVTDYDDSFTAYGALIKKKAVCQGYTAAFNLLAAKAGIASIAVCGTGNGENHTWNYVKTGKKYRYVDCTWDNTTKNGNQANYRYFNVTQKTLAKDHYWKKKNYTAGYLKYSKYLM